MFVLYSYLFTAETGNLYIKLAKTPLIYCNYFGDFVHQNVPKWLGDISRTFFCIELSFFSNAPRNFTHGQFFSFATKQSAAITYCINRLAISFFKDVKLKTNTI